MMISTFLKAKTVILRGIEYTPYRSDAFSAISNIEELNSSPLPAIVSGDEEPLSSDSEWLPSLQQDTTTGKSIRQVEYRKVNVCSYVEHSPLNFIFAIAYEFLKTFRSILKKKVTSKRVKDKLFIVPFHPRNTINGEGGA